MTADEERKGVTYVKRVYEGDPLESDVFHPGFHRWSLEDVQT